MATRNVPDVARDLIMRALDALSDRMAAAEPAETQNPVQRLAGSWRSLSPEDRDVFAGYVGAAAGGLAAALPVAMRAARKRVRRRRRPAAVTRVAKPVAETVLPESDSKDKKKKDKSGDGKKHKKHKKDKGKKKDKKDKKDKKNKKKKK